MIGSTRRTRRQSPRSWVLAGAAIASVTALVLGGSPASAATGAGGAGLSRAGMPKGFEAQSVTWVSPEQGWVLGAAPCSTRRCTYVIGTTDGAKTWTLLSSVNAPIPISKIGRGQSAGVTEIRFATPLVGWIFGAELLSTTDGGHSWTAVTIPGGGKQVVDLAGSSSGTYALVSPCKQHRYCSEPFGFWHATLAGPWVHVLSLPAGPSGTVSVFGQTVYVGVSLADGPGGANSLYASTDGTDFSSRTPPCPTAPPYALLQVVASSATDAAFLCEGNTGQSAADKSVYRTTDAATTYRSAGTTYDGGIAADLAASPSGNLAVAASSAASFLYINDTHKTTWTWVIDKGDSGLGWNDLVYVSDQVAYVVYAPADIFYPLGQVFVTHDSGRHWTVVAF